MLRTTTGGADSVATCLNSRAQAGTRWVLGHAVPRGVIALRARSGDLQSQAIAATRESQELPLELFDRIRDTGSFYRGRFAHVTARQPVVRELLGSPDVQVGIGLDDAGGRGLAGAIGSLFAWAQSSAPLGPLTPPSLLATEPPDHSRMRKLVTRVFTVKAVEQLRERTEQVAVELLDELAAAQASAPGADVDLVARYAALLPVTVICEILGVPLEERDQVLHFGSMAAPSLDMGQDARTFFAVEKALFGFDAWLRDHVDRARRSPGEDLLSQLVAVRDDDGARLSDDELVSTAGLVLAAGFETTVNLIGNGTALLDAHRDQRRALLAGDAAWLGAVEETLRYDPPVLLTGRTITRDTEIGGTRLTRGGFAIALLGAANRDPEVFADPNRFDVTRENADQHVAFSGGRHFCLGAALARMEGEVALRALHERFPDLSLRPGAQRRTTRILRGYATMPARLTA